jgi:hypothetical protein
VAGRRCGFIGGLQSEVVADLTHSRGPGSPHDEKIVVSSTDPEPAQAASDQLAGQRNTSVIPRHHSGG